MTSPGSFLPGGQRQLASRTSEAIGRNPDRRTAVVTEFVDGELSVSVGGGDARKIGYIDSYDPVVGDVVAIVLQRSTWLCIGRLADALNPLPPSTNGIRILAPSQSTSSASFVDIPGLEFPFTKRRPESRLLIEFIGSTYASTAGGVVEIAAQINGVDEVVTRFYFNIILQHLTQGGFQFVSGVPAGTYTVQGRYRKAAGGGTISMNEDDSLSMTVTELD